MRKETDDRGVSLQFGLELGDQSQRLGIRIVEVEDDEARQIFVFTGGKSSNGFLLVLDEGDLDSKFASGLLNLRDEEEIFDEEEDLGRRVLRDWNGPALRVVDRLGVALVAASMAVAA